MTDPTALTVTAELHYRDPRTAIEWLSRTFGFEARMLIADEHGRVIFADVGLGSASFAIAPEEASRKLSPVSVGGVNTQLVRIRGEFDVEAHCAKARAAGAKIVQNPSSSSSATGSTSPPTWKAFCGALRSAFREPADRRRTVGRSAFHRVDAH